MKKKTLYRVLGSAVAIWAGAWAALKFVPLPAALSRPSACSIVLLDRHGAMLRETRTSDAFGQPVRLVEVPEIVRQAFLAAEDKRFYEHGGVDWLAVGRAARDGIIHRRIVSGASTISQQLIKVAEPRPRTWRTKIIEAVTAQRLEQVWSKDRILEEYLNRVDFGNLNIGVVAAADFYFGKPLGDLTAAEAAFIAGLPKNPTRLNPHRSLSATQSRQRTVLRRMRDNGWLGAEAYARAVAEPAKLNPPDRVFHAPHFVDFALRRFASPCAPRRTTLDLDLNRVIERKLREELRGLRDRSVRNGSVVVIDNASGGVLALVGSEDYFAPGEGQVNGAWSARSAGSTLKPFTYLIALERGATPATIYADVPTEFSTSAGIYRVENYAKRCSGPVSLRQALACSLNIPAVRALNEIGGPSVLHRRLLDWGFTSIDRLPDRYGLGLTIGNAEVRLLELTNAYASLARLGEYRPWRIFLDQPAESSRQSADARTCWQIADILSDNAARIPAFGANSALRFDFPVACKTGTSTDYRDNWAMGYTPEFTVGVWIGNFDGSAMRGVSGVTGAAPVLHAVFEHLHERFGTSWYAPPPGLVECDIHAWTGHRVAQARSESRRERFLAEHLPPMESPEDYDSSGRVKLPVEYAAWLADGGDAFAQRAAVNAAPGALQIMEPKSGTVFVLDPDLPGSQRVRLVAAGGGAIEWRCESLNWHARGAQTETVLVEGEHRVEAIDSSTGMRAATWIRVKSL